IRCDLRSLRNIADNSGVSLGMRMRWSLILPIAGLILFAAVSYRSMDVNHHEEGATTKYYWWSSLRLDSDPLNKNPKPASPCQDKKENCVQWELSYQWVQPGLLDKLLVVSALPAFLAGAAIVIVVEGSIEHHRHARLRFKGPD